jgi:hypothetical protein
LKNTNLRRPLALRNPGKTRIVSQQFGLFQQAPPYLKHTHVTITSGYRHIAADNDDAVRLFD